MGMQINKLLPVLWALTFGALIKRKSLNLATWMNDLPLEIRRLPIIEIAIPGSHNVFTYYLDKEGPWGPDADALKEIFEDLDIIDNIAKEVTYNWAQTQFDSTINQLNDGIRYLDYRAMHHPDHPFEVYFGHALYSTSASEEMEQIRRFLLTSPNELLILDFNHFYSMTDDLFDSLENVIRSRLGPYLCHPVTSDILSSLTLQDFEKMNCQVIVSYSASNRPDFAWSNIISSPWGNKQNADDLFHFLDTNLENGRPADRLYVSQGVMTEGALEIATGLRSSLYEWTAYMLPMVNEWVQGKRIGDSKNGINIILRDFTDSTFSQNVINMNYKY